MWKQISRLTGVQLCNIFGLNEARFSHDKKKKRNLTALLCLYVFLFIMLAGYVGMMAFAYIHMGMGEIIPSYILTLTSMVILFLSIFKAGQVIFETKTYDMLIAMPISPKVIVISRFLTMYVFNMLVSILTMLPSAAVYAVYEKPAVSFYLMILTGIVLLPLIPMTIATAIGAVIIAVSSRMKHKNLVSIVLSILLMIGILVGSTVSGIHTERMSDEFLKQLISNLSQVIMEQLHRMYPPSAWFSQGVLNGDWVSYLVFAIVSVGIFAAFTAIVSWKFVAVCSALNARIMRNDYKMGALQQSSPRKALYRKELRRYFSSSLYVMNTLIGYIMMVLFGAALLIAETNAIEEMIGIPGIIRIAAPVIMGAICMISPTTTSAISMEGDSWWIIKSLPVTARTVFDSKLMVNFTVAAPCYLLAVILCCIAMRTNLIGCLWLLLLPAASILYSSVVGIYVNSRMPLLHWDSEAAVVKQSSAVMITMLISFASIAVMAGVLFLVPSGMHDFANAGITAALLGAALYLYRKCSKMDLRKIE